MSGAASSQNPETTKATVNESTQTPSELQKQEKKQSQLEEDDEFEDFPVEGVCPKSVNRINKCVDKEHARLGR